MDDVRDKLNHCFALAFPKLDPSQYATATAENTEGWDSLAQVTLIAVISEEFGREIDYEEFEGVTSFGDLARTLQVR
jgi:acyl carrier protein